MTHETVCPTHGATMTPRAPSSMSDEQTWCGQWFDCSVCGLSVLIPSAALNEQNRLLALPLLFGYRVEPVSQDPGKVGYLLHGPKVTYKLMRCVTHPANLYVLNSKGNISNIKGNYRFSDRDGTLRAIYT